MNGSTPPASQSMAKACASCIVGSAFNEAKSCATPNPHPLGQAAGLAGRRESPRALSVLRTQTTSNWSILATPPTAPSVDEGAKRRPNPRALGCGTRSAAARAAASNAPLPVDALITIQMSRAATPKLDQRLRTALRRPAHCPVMRLHRRFRFAGLPLDRAGVLTFIRPLTNASAGYVLDLLRGRSPAHARDALWDPRTPHLPHRPCRARICAAMPCRRGSHFFLPLPACPIAIRALEDLGSFSGPNSCGATARRRPPCDARDDASASLSRVGVAALRRINEEFYGYVKARDPHQHLAGRAVGSLSRAP